jgi:hypothetical protein
VLWTMSVEQLVWWWDKGWRTWARQQGIDPDEEPEKKITTPDRETLYKQYPELKKRGIVRR